MKRSKILQEMIDGAKEGLKDIKDIKDISQEETRKPEKTGKKKIPGAKVNEKRNDIAIIGVACRFPGATTCEEYWENLKNGISSIEEIPEDRWDWKKYFGDPVKEVNKGNCKWGGFIKDIDLFDSGFFNLSAREAESMDPQQRIMLQLAWTCCENAGIPPSSLAGKQVGVFLSTFNYDYKEILEQENRIMETYNSIGTAITIIPNRISHFFNISGPSLALDAACSGSLIALHIAMNSLRLGECEMAFVGGVNLLLTPTRHILFSKTRMLSPTGSCKTFDDDANGYVRGEGAGIIILKPLEKAIKDGNFIYGVVKGSAINHCGKTRTITYPNPDAQADVIVKAIKDAGIPYNTINFIEAHGTGTAKGDPMEFRGLSKAFQTLSDETGITPENNYCGLSSVKTNIGHLEAAAGIAGLIKILLSFQHKQIPKLQNYSRLNNRITIENTPFFMVDTLKTWDPLCDEEGKKLPRRAGISSFGFGGTNSHVILEEPPVPVKKNNKAYSVCVVCLSAKTMVALNQKRKDLLAWLKKNDRQNLQDISMMLLFGRDHFKYREAEVVKDIPDLINKLSSEYPENLNVSHVPEETKNKLEQDMADRLESIYRDFSESNERDETDITSDLLFLSGLYREGHKIDWKKIYPDYSHNNVSLPAYPFAHERYWISDDNIIDNRIDEEKIVNNVSPSNTSLFHPLLHNNISDFFTQRFYSVFTGDEFFFTDHVLRGHKVLPGVAYLEMIRKAVEIAARLDNDMGKSIRIKNIVWLRFITAADGSVPINVDLELEKDNQIFIKVFSLIDENEVIFANGEAEIIKVNGNRYSVDINKIREMPWSSVIPAEQCYSDYKNIGLDYGRGHRGIVYLYLNGQRALARITMPESVIRDSKSYVLHPSIIDAAFQSGISLLTRGQNDKIMIPFSLDELEIFDACHSAVWASLYLTEENKTKKINIDICNDTGNVCIRVKGLLMRAYGETGEHSLSEKTVDIRQSQEQSDEEEQPLVRLQSSAEDEQILNPADQENESSVQTIDDEFPTFTLTQVWEKESLQKSELTADKNEHVVIIGGTTEIHMQLLAWYPGAEIRELTRTDTINTIKEKLKPIKTIDHIIWLGSKKQVKSAGDEELIEAQEDGVILVFKLIKALLELGYGSKDIKLSLITFLSQCISPGKNFNPSHSSITGLAGSLSKEYPNWHICQVDLDTESNLPLDDILQISNVYSGNQLVYRNRTWHKEKLLLVEFPDSQKTLYREKGVYVIIGGAGGIGEIWTEYMIKNFKAHIIWIGRREKDEEIQKKIDRLKSYGEPPLYISADAKDKKALKNAYKKIKARYNTIHGVIHSAIVLQDQSLFNMTETYFRNGLSVKVDICVRIAQIFKNEPLDFVLFFSSVMSYLKSAGQSNYASGCTFKDTFAKKLSDEWNSEIKVMNWGYWGTIGIVASKEYQERMYNSGIGSIDYPEAMESLERLLSAPLNQIALMKMRDPEILDGVDENEKIFISSSLPSVELQEVR